MLTNTIDTTGAVVGQSFGPVPLKISGHKGTIYVINQSPVCFDVDFYNGYHKHVPANWARPIRDIPSSIQQFLLTVTHIPSGSFPPTFQHVIVETYFASEDTSGLQDTPIFFNANALDIGQSGSISHVLGNLQVDGFLHGLAQLVIDGAVGIQNTIARGLSISGGIVIDALQSSGSLTVQTVQVIAGTSGEIDYGFPFWDNSGVNNGGIKVMTISYRGYIQAVTNPTVLFPTPMNRCIYLRGSSAGIVETFMNGASNVNINDITTLGGTAGGVDTSSSTTHSDTFGWVGAATDRIKFGSSTSAIDGFGLIVGT